MLKSISCATVFVVGCVAATTHGGDLGEFAFPLAYAEGEEEGRGWLCPSVLAPKDRILMVARQSFSARVLPDAGTIALRLYVPAFRNLGEQRRLASRVTVKLEDAPLEHKAELIYSRPHRNPFLRIECSPAMGRLEVQVDSWLSHVAAPENPARVQLQLVSKAETSEKILAAFNTRHGIASLKHWWTDPGDKLSPKPRTLGIERQATLATVLGSLTATANQVQFDLSRNSLVPAEALRGGDSGSRASLVWYCLQNELPATMVAGYSRELLDEGSRGWHAWNLFAYGGSLIGDVRGGSPYLGPDQANYLATCIGCEHLLDEFPALPRYASHNNGFWFTDRGRATADKSVVLGGTSAFGRLLRNGNLQVSSAAGEAGCGQQQNDLNRLLASPPAGILELAQQVDRERKRINGGR